MLTVSSVASTMHEAALVATVACALVAWSNPFGWLRRSGRQKLGLRPRKRVSFSESKTVIHHLVGDQDLTSAERRALTWSPAEIREFARSSLIDDWIQGSEA